MPRPRRLLLHQILPVCLVAVASSTKHSVHIIGGPSLIGPVGAPFGFTRGGVYELSVRDFALEPPSSSTPRAVDAGFFLQRFRNEADFYHHWEELRSNRTLCSFELFRKDVTDDVFQDDDEGQDDLIARDKALGITAANGIVLHVRNPTTTSSSSPQTIRYQFQNGEEGLYFLVYQVCGDEHDDYRSSFRADFHYINYDSFGNPSYLTAGEMGLPLLYGFFSISYLLCAIVWMLQWRQEAPAQRRDHNPRAIHKIHYLMSILICVKFLATLVESLRYHGIRRHGHAEGWTVLYYMFTMVRGIFLFVVILLLGTGWSIVKPFLNDKEKQVVVVVLLLQVVNQVALVTLEHFSEGELTYARWTAVLHLVDIVCCCAVLLPIVWQVNQLEKTMGEDEAVSWEAEEEHPTPMTEEERELALEEGDKGQVLHKLRLFRSFYLLVVAYIYATRILVYLFASILSYKYLWVRYFVVELVTMTFYVSAGVMFRPMSDNQYARVHRDGDDDDGATAVEMRMTKSQR